MAGQYHPTLTDYIFIARRRTLLLLAVAGLIFAAAVATALLLPPVYQSAGTILVESQQIPAQMVQATVTNDAEDRIAVIQQRVMTRDNLLRIIKKYRLFQGERDSYTSSQLIDKMNERTSVELIRSDPRGGGGRVKTIAFKISFEARDPTLTYRVTNELVTLFLAESARTRTERAVETTRFLAAEADRLAAKLADLEAQVAAYKQQHSQALPEHRELRWNMLQRAVSELQDVERKHQSVQQELRFLEVELAAAKGGVDVPIEPAVATSPVMELQRLKQEYAKLTLRYTDSHPAMRALKHQMAALEARIPDGAETPASATELMVAKVQTRIAAAKASLTSLAKQEQNLRAQIAQIQQHIIQTPQVERGLTALNRDYENTRAEYQEMLGKKMSAQLAENLEQDNKAERFVLLESPRMPDQPVKPDRKKIVAMGFFFALAGPGGLVMLLGIVNPRVCGSRGLAAVLRQHPLAVIPSITTREEIIRRRLLLLAVIVVSILFVAGLLVAVHFLYMPLDQLVLKIQTSVV